MQGEKQTSVAEIQQLREIGAALREELESQKLETQKVVQSTKQLAASEIQQLQEATGALREKLEREER